VYLLEKRPEESPCRDHETEHGEAEQREAEHREAEHREVTVRT